MMERSAFVHVKQDEAYSQYENGVMFQEDIEKVYDEIDYKIKLPDFLGKTVRVSQKQFANVFQMVEAMAKKAGISNPTVYVYEDYYYGAESYGISEFWIELSAKTIQDFTEEELKFVLAREIYKIADGVTKQRTMMEERFKVIHQMAPDQFEKSSKLKKLGNIRLLRVFLRNPCLHNSDFRKVFQGFSEDFPKNCTLKFRIFLRKCYFPSEIFCNF